MSVVVGIDASNIRAGGGLTHLIELLSNANPELSGIRHVVVWAGGHTISRLPQRDWLEKVHVPLLDKCLPQRVYWQQRLLPAALVETGCSLLFSPGGTCLSVAVPRITMSQNMLPFDRTESARFGLLSAMRLKMVLLRRSQSSPLRVLKA